MAKSSNKGSGKGGGGRDKFSATPHTPRVVPNSTETRTATPHTPRVQPQSSQGGKPQSSGGDKK